MEPQEVQVAADMVRFHKHPMEPEEQELQDKETPEGQQITMEQMPPNKPVVVAAALVE
jgi:hypothetical protein